MENSSENSDDEHRRHPSSGRSTSRLSSLEYLGTVAAASEIIDLGAYANVIECSRLQAPDPNFHPYLLASNSDSENFSNLQPCVSVVRKQSPNRNENQLSGNYIPIDKSSCSVPYQNVVPFHRMIWNSDRNDPVNHPENVPSYNNSEKNYQESTSRHSISAYSDISEKSRVYSSVQTYDQSRQNLTTGSKGPEKESLRWPQQIKESLKNCDDSSIKLLADACLISHERQSFKFLEEPFLGLIDMQEISSFDRELTNIDDKQKSEGEDFSNYYSDCCEFNAVICHRTVDDQDANNKNESNMRDIFVMNNESSDAILPSYSEIYRTYTRDAVSRKREIVKRLQRSKPTTKQFVKHLLRKVYSELKSKKRKLSSIDKFLSTNHVYSKNSKKNSVRSAPTILILSKACQEPKDVLLSRKLNFTADCEIRNRMKNKTELMKHAENFAKRARNSTGYVEKYVCLGKIQAHACHELSGITHCLECVYPYRVSSDYCRFMDFRKIHKNLPTNKLESHGFIDYPSYAKYSLVDKNKTLFNEFLPRRRLVENDDKWSQRLACYVIRCLVDQYKLLLAREEKILNDCSKWKLTDKINVPWRDAFNARELCDICSTTIFNLHLMCMHCALDVCIDCFYARLREEKRTLRALNRILDEKISLYKIDSDKINYLLPLPGDQDTSKEVGPRNSRLPLFSYLFGKDVLILESPKNPLNIFLFQHHWYKGKPVVINRVLQDLEPMMWRPTILEEKCAGRSTEGTIVDCRTGAVIENFDVSLFWAGFLDCHKRIDGSDGRKLLLKLKDWPSGDKFSELLQEHFQKFCKALPLPQYTHPNSGQFNLATNLPSFCIEPDLGPKLYIAYEMIFEPNKGTTNLHLDVSDAVNVLVNVTTPANINPSYLYCAILKHLEEQDLDPADLERARKCPSRIGALWTIFKPEDSETIRMYLHELAAEDRKSDCDDPIHDQMLYLDVPLRKRLETERGVRGYSFVQMLGDAVFIPAGAAHQVQNLLCCVKVAEDFVSPEGISYCATIAGEFRNLTKAHTNHEDKLQLPNVILHSLRKAASVLNENGLQGSAS